MADTTLAAITTAAADADLRDRIVSAAAQAGIDAAQHQVDSRLRQLVSTPITDAGDTLASVLEYAIATYTPTPRPGQNAAAVTDQMIRDAVAAVLAKEETP